MNPGSLTLFATNSDTGGTTITAGTLALGHATDTLPHAGTVLVNSGTLTVGANNDTETGGGATGTTGVLTGAAGSWYLNQFQAGDDFIVSGKVGDPGNGSGTLRIAEAGVENVRRRLEACGPLMGCFSILF